MVSDLDLQENYDLFLAAVASPVTDSSVDPKESAAKVTIDIVFENQGDDYTSYVKFDGVFLIDGKVLKSIDNQLGLIDAGDKMNRRMNFSLELSDVPPDTINSIIQGISENKHPVFSFEIRNVDYEKF